VLTREEAVKLWEELDAMGTMVIEGFYGFTMGAEEPQFVGGCHCCGCCCTILQGGRMGHLTETVQRSNYRVVKDHAKCTNCGECVRRCQFFARPLRPRMTSRSITGKSASDVVRALWDAGLMRFTWSLYLKKSGFMFPPVLRNGKSGAWSIWQHRSNAVGEQPRFVR